MCYGSGRELFGFTSPAEALGSCNLTRSLECCLTDESIRSFFHTLFFLISFNFLFFSKHARRGWCKCKVILKIVISEARVFDRCKISDVRPVLRMRLSHYNWLCLHVGWECTYSHQRCVHDTFAVAKLEASHWGDQGEIIADRNGNK